MTKWHQWKLSWHTKTFNEGGNTVNVNYMRTCACHRKIKLCFVMFHCSALSKPPSDLMVSTPLSTASTRHTILCKATSRLVFPAVLWGISITTGCWERTQKQFLSMGLEEFVIRTRKVKKVLDLTCLWSSNVVKNPHSWTNTCTGFDHSSVSFFKH